MSRLEDAAELVELVEPILARPGQPTQDAKVEMGAGLSHDGDGEGNGLYARAAARGVSLTGLLVDQDEFENVEVLRQDEQMVGAASAEVADEFVAGLGRDRPKLDEDDAEELLVVLGE